jgi:hypothetical protein
VFCLQKYDLLSQRDEVIKTFTVPASAISHATSLCALFQKDTISHVVQPAKQLDQKAFFE